MMYLSGVSRPELRAMLPARDLGLLWTPASYSKTQHVADCTWAADNGCFTMGQRFDSGRWLAWLDRVAALRGTCVFATAPDVVGDARATLRRSSPLFTALRDRGYRIGYVLQNGQESLPMPWSEVDAVFIGGDDEWKLSPHAERLVRAAKERGLWAHMGRVNSLKRLTRAAAMGCDSVDGTFLRWGAPGVNTTRMQGWLTSLNRAAQAA